MNRLFISIFVLVLIEGILRLGTFAWHHDHGHSHNNPICCRIKFSDAQKQKQAEIYPFFEACKKEIGKKKVKKNYERNEIENLLYKNALESENLDQESDESGGTNERKKKLNKYMCLFECTGKKVGIVSKVV